MTVFNTIRIQVPETQKPKGGKIIFKPVNTLTKTGNLTTRKGEKSIQLIKGPSNEKVKILYHGNNAIIPKQQEPKPKKPRQPRQNKSIVKNIINDLIDDTVNRVETKNVLNDLIKKTEAKVISDEIMGDILKNVEKTNEKKKNPFLQIEKNFNIDYQKAREHLDTMNKKWEKQKQAAIKRKIKIKK